MELIAEELPVELEPREYFSKEIESDECASDAQEEVESISLDWRSS